MELEASDSRKAQSDTSRIERSISFLFCLFDELVRSPGFEPGLSGWEPDVLTKLDYDRLNCPKSNQFNLEDFLKVT